MRWMQLYIMDLMLHFHSWMMNFFSFKQETPAPSPQARNVRRQTTPEKIETVNLTRKSKSSKSQPRSKQSSPNSQSSTKSISPNSGSNSSNDANNSDRNVKLYKRNISSLNRQSLNPEILDAPDSILKDFDDDQVPYFQSAFW